MSITSVFILIVNVIASFIIFINIGRNMIIIIVPVSFIVNIGTPDYHSIIVIIVDYNDKDNARGKVVL